MGIVMNTEVKNLASLKKIVATVYLCQVLSFLLAGLPLLFGVWLNFLNKEDAKGTWLESHFEWQIKTAWLAIAGFALAGVTFEFILGIPVLIATIMLMVFRIVRGWNALNANEQISE
jgi:uncharacterized membrane protein